MERATSVVITGRGQSGFSLLELILVIVVMVVALTVLAPRLADLSGDAHRSSVSSTAGAFASAVVLVRSRWTASGAEGAVENLRGFGSDDINVSHKGWPVSVNGGTDPRQLALQDCLDLWRSLLQSNAPSIARQPAEGVIYQALLEQGRCHYRYLEAEGRYGFHYDPQQGEVVTILNE
ncbi:MAG: prepilin-type N-terminal cleavage/methylation domain-containing protein [Oleiphilaceae bacterium]|nr:prepilin-type N-terminal cleavage/methylation domain-containing protein [Oleiphilaceae bacterium]